MNRPTRLAIAGMVMFGLAASITQQSADAMSLKQLRDKLQASTRNIKSYQSKLRTTKKRQHAATVQVYAAQRRLGVHRARLSDIRGQLAQTRDALGQARANLRVVEGRLKKRNQLLSARLLDTYKHGNVSYVSALLGSDDLWELLSRSYVIRKVLDSDVDLVDSIKEDKRAVERYKATLEQKERERSDLERQQAAVTQASLRDTRQKQYYLKAIERDRAAYEQAMAEEQQASYDIGAMIRRMQSTPAGQKRAANPWKGSFICPLAANYRITSRFGWRIHPINHVRSFHTGMDMACPEGTPIRAVAGGVVILAADFGAYGKHVVIDHGGNISTIYGHCSRLCVSGGATVRQGQTIGYVGSTGWSTGPHLHFEKQKNGSPVSPM